MLLYQGTIYREIYTGTDYSAYPLMQLQANTWYELVLQVDGSSAFRIEVWPRENPGSKVTRTESHPDFAGRHWTFTTNWYTGIGDIDTYTETQILNVGQRSAM